VKVGVLSPTTWQLVEKMAALFPEGVEVVGPLADDGHYWNDYRRKTEEWAELGLSVSLHLAPYSEIDFSGYNPLIESIETFYYAREWKNHCHRLECPILLKACWTRDPRPLMPRRYRRKTLTFPALLEMPAHAPVWRRAGFEDVNVIPNPVGEWWFEREWTGSTGQMLFVLSGTKAWRGDPSWHGLEIWEELCRRFPGRGYHHDGDVSYRTSREMTALYAASRVFVNLDRPYGQGERPLTLAFTEALSAGLPVVARDIPGLSYRTLIDGNGVCTNDVDEMADFIDRCFRDMEFARRCSERSREIARETFSLARLRPRYDALIGRARAAFDRGPRPPSISDRVFSVLERLR
jgi:glycosyltransferase involved in cell wall biosynthesis